jgi:hypothetical protein
MNRWRARLVAVGAVAALLLVARAVRAEREGPRDPPLDDGSLWTGVRAGAFVPYGGLFAGRNLVAADFRDVAEGGPGFELDVGARWARKFVTYGFAELAFLGTGHPSAWTSSHGAQTSAGSQAVGVGVRWIPNPGDWGPIVELGLGYRWLAASWEDGTTLRLSGFGDVRVGAGANLRLARRLELSPVLMLYSGSFRDRTLADRPIGDTSSAYTAVALELGAHFDL